MSGNQCPVCGQFAGKGHRCVSNPFDDIVLAQRIQDAYKAHAAVLVDSDEHERLKEELSSRVERAKEALKGSPTRPQIPSPECENIASLLAVSVGESEQDAQQAVRRAYTEYAPAPFVNGDAYADPDVTATTLSALLTENPETATLVDKATRGTLMLTHRELDALTRVPLILVEGQSLQQLQPLNNDATEWIPSVEQRRCTQCGQFIGIRCDHFCMSTEKLDIAVGNAAARSRFVPRFHPFGGGQDAPKRRSGDYFGPRAYWAALKPHTLDADLFNDGEARSIDQYDTIDLTLEEQQDGYHSTEWCIRGNLPTHILASYIEKNKGKPTLPLPPELRSAFVECPTAVGQNLPALAAIIEPPLDKYEIGHMIEAGGKPVAQQLLISKRTSSEAREYITHTPTLAATSAAVNGELDVTTLTEMAASADPRMRAIAAIAPNLPVETLIGLATDPDRDVRKATCNMTDVLNPQNYAGQNVEVNKGWRAKAAHSFEKEISNVRALKGNAETAVNRNPRILASLINDPDRSIASEALHRVGRNTASVYAASQITDPERFTAVQAAFADTELWPLTRESINHTRNEDEREAIQRVLALPGPKSTATF